MDSVFWVSKPKNNMKKNQLLLIMTPDPHGASLVVNASKCKHTSPGAHSSLNPRLCALAALPRMSASGMPQLMEHTLCFTMAR